MATRRTNKKAASIESKISEAQPSANISNLELPPLLEPILHQVDCACGEIILAFSVIEVKRNPTDEEIKTNQFDRFLPSWKSCEKCKLYHNIVDVSTSMMSKSLPPNTITNDEQPAIPKSLFELLDSYELETAYYQYVAFLIKNGIWGKEITLSAKLKGYDIAGERLQLRGPDDYIITPYKTRTVLPTPDEPDYE
jgi:hypothetical protein